MENKTLPIPDHEKGYIVQLSVFHQLHCLLSAHTKIAGFRSPERRGHEAAVFVHCDITTPRMQALKGAPC